MTILVFTRYCLSQDTQVQNAQSQASVSVHELAQPVTVPLQASQEQQAPQVQLKNTRTSVVMINPAGHAKDPGRTLINSNERAETFKCAEAMQRLLLDRLNVRSVFTRAPGEELVHLQNASFANRLGSDLFLSIHLYKEERERPRVYIYHLVYDPVLDYTHRSRSSLSFLALRHTNTVNITKTKHWAGRIKSIFTEANYQNQCDFYGPYGIPVKPLAGIISPALLIEIGINDDNKWIDVVDLIVRSLSFLTE